MKINSKAAIIIGAFALSAAAPAVAQTTTDPATGTTIERDDDDSGKWGLAGLLGLLGLLGLKRRDRDDDARRTGTNNR